MGSTLPARGREFPFFSVGVGAGYCLEFTRVVALLRLDVAEEWLPAAVGVPDGVPQPAVLGDADQVQLAVHRGAGHSPELARVVALLRLHVPERRLPAAVHM